MTFDFARFQSPVDAGCCSGSAPYLISRNCSPTAPTKAMRCARWPPNQRQTRVVNRVADRARNSIERYFGRIKRLRGIANRYHKHDHVYLKQVLLGCVHFMTIGLEDALTRGCGYWLTNERRCSPTN